MNKHLSQDQLSMWILGRSTAEERRHGQKCPQCRAELARFEAPVAAFRCGMMEWSDRDGAPRIEDVLTSPRRPQRMQNSFYRWAVAGVAVLLLVAVPIYRKDQAPIQRTQSTPEIPPLPPIDIPAEANADEILMDAVSTHISRTIPAPMEPIMALIPNPENTGLPGGTP